MNRLKKVVAIVPCFLGCAVAAQAASPTLPIFGHYTTYGVVTAATPVGGGTCPSAVGDKINGQLALNTVTNKLEVVLRTPVETDAGLAVVKYTFKKSSGTRVKQAGTVEYGVEGTTPASAPYTATFTPFDPNSFAATFEIDTAACTLASQAVFIRSSAD